MAAGKVSAFLASIPSGASTSNALDLGGSYKKVFVDPTGVGGSTMFFASDSLTGTYRQVKYNVASGMSAPQTCTVGSAVSGSWVEVPGLIGLQYVKVAADSTKTDGLTVKIIVSE